MPKSTTNKCETCDAWFRRKTKLAWSTGIKGDAPLVGKTENIDWGTCHATSPSLNKDWGWPLCHKEEWCREWKQK